MYWIGLIYIIGYVDFLPLEKLLLDDVKSYRYITHGQVDCTLDDKELYQELLDAFKIMGMNEETEGMRQSNIAVITFKHQLNNKHMVHYILDKSAFGKDLNCSGHGSVYCMQYWCFDVRNRILVTFISDQCAIKNLSSLSHQDVLE